MTELAKLGGKSLSLSYDTSLSEPSVMMTTRTDFAAVGGGEEVVAATEILPFLFLEESVARFFVDDILQLFFLCFPPQISCLFIARNNAIR